MFLGIEIGGTKLQIGVGDAQHPTLAQMVIRHVPAAIPGNKQDRAAIIREMIADVVPTLIQKYPIQQIGIGFGGPVNSQTGVTVISHQVDGWEAFPLRNWCESNWKIPTVIVNDCDVAALAESTLGAGRHVNSCFYVTVGTGVGGGLVINRQLVGLGRPAVAEIGHLRPGLKMTDSHDTVESYSSGLGLETRWKHALQSDDPKLTARELVSQMQQGNQLAQEIWDQGIQTLGWAIAQVVTLTAVEAVIVGGGVPLAGEEYFYAPIKAAIESYVFPPLLGSYEILPPALGTEVVIHGAIALAASTARV
jgi:glucokinase